MEHKNPTRRKCIRLWLWTLLILIILAIFILAVLYAIACKVGYAYALLIDAGSTSSKLTVFKWKDWPFKRNGYVEEVASSKVKPGISASRNDPSEAFERLKPSILKLVDENIPEGSQKYAQLFLAATAGMRLLLLANPLKAAAVMETLQLMLPSANLTVSNPYSDVRIMSGRDEGVYAWITVNYASGNFGNRNVPPVDESETLGALDLGGASTQITFVPEDRKPAPHTSVVRLYGKDYRLYSYSYLCYGKSSAEKRVWAEIIGNQTSGQIDNPCLLKGNIKVEDTKSIYEDQCVSSRYAEDFVGSTLIKPAGLPESITFVGTGDAQLCRHYIQKLFPHRACTHNSCMFHNVYRPHLRGKFRAFSGFTYVATYLGFQNSNPTRDEFRYKVHNFCLTPWKEVHEMTPAADQMFVENFCFDGIYVDELLSHYGFNTSESWRSLTFSYKINGITVSWALGYTIDATGMIKSRSPKIDLDLIAFASSVAALGVLFIGVLVLLIHSSARENRPRIA